MIPQIFDGNLPQGWTCAATSDGQIFFIDDNSKETSWLHPISGSAVQSGCFPSQDLPTGWERGTSNEGISYYVDHTNRQTTFVHPLAGSNEVPAEGIQCHSPPPFRNDTSFSSINTGHDHRRQGSKKSSVGSWVKGPDLRGPKPATVTHKGWLFKQGSDGLQFWKRRWFVLSEYCLYYYKGPEEDKVLGYIPLPSFRICPPAHEDRVYRRHVFKAEHDNTRSYFFAAESKEKMTQWMNALSLASILQKDTSLDDKQNSRTYSDLRSDRPSLSSVNSSTSHTNPSTENSDSGIDGYNIKRSNPCGFSGQKEVEYPRERLGSPYIEGKPFEEGSEGTRSITDGLNTSVDSFLLSRPGSRQPFYANAPPKPRRLNTSYEAPTPEPGNIPNSRDIYTAKGKLPISLRKQQPYPKDRRTPEAYGATSVALLRDDYEDVYSDEKELGNRKKSRRISQASLQSSDRQLLEELNSISSTQDKQIDHISLSYNVENIKRRQPPPRPRSADFLEYDHNKYGDEIMWNNNSKGEIMTANRLDIRPKSSVGYHEGDFWSEENYAAKMRESAIYNSYLKGGIRSQRNKYQRQDGVPRSTMANLARVPPAGASSPVNFMAKINLSPVNSIQSRKGGISPLQNNQNRQPTSNTKMEGVDKKQSFLRSASARLPRNASHSDTLNSSIAEEFPESDKKREESMKRLLEWKQRMLQSPLTRKSSSRPESAASSTASSSKMNSYLGAYTDTGLHKSRDIHVIQESQNPDPTGIMAYHRCNPSSGENRFTRNVNTNYSNSSIEPHPTLQQRPAPQGESAPDKNTLLGQLPILSKGKREANIYSDCSKSEERPAAVYSNICDDFEGKNIPNEKESNYQRNQFPWNSDFEFEDTNSIVNDSEMATSHDYVNLSATDGVVYNNKGEIRAETVYFDDQSNYKLHSNSSDNNYNQCNGNLYATRDPYYVTDVQMPAKIAERKANTKRNLCNEFELTSNITESHYENSNYYLPSSDFETSYSKDRNVRNFSAESPITCSPMQEQNNPIIVKIPLKYDDNNSLEKYSDSGYDTLRHDQNDKFEENNSRGELYDRLWADDINSKCQSDSSNLATEDQNNWTSEKFEKSWTNVESSSRLDESDVIKEYSYEYITPEKNEEFFNSQGSLQKSRINLASLESPKIVQETQQATSTSLVKDKIKSFSSLTEQAKLAAKELADISAEHNKSSSSYSNNTLEDFLKSKTLGITPNSDEDFPSNISMSTKNASIGNELREILIHETSDIKNNIAYKTQQFDEELDTPAGVSPNKKIEFVFKDEKDDQNEEQFQKEIHPKFNTPRNSCVKELLKNFQSKLDDRSSELLLISNLNSINNAAVGEHIEEDETLVDLFPPPPMSFLEDIRENSLPLFTPYDADEPPERPPKNFITRNRSMTPSRDSMLEMLSADIDRSACLAYENDGPPKECAPPPPIIQQKISPQIGSSSTNSIIEDDYLPMSPPRKPFYPVTKSAGRSSSNINISSKHISKLEQNFSVNEFSHDSEIEEHTYIEMPGEKATHLYHHQIDIGESQMKEFKSTEVKSGPESPRYYEIGEKDGQHYEYISKQGSHYESIYMEVQNVTKESNRENQKPEVPAKPINLMNKNYLCKKSASESALSCISKARTSSLLPEGSPRADDEGDNNLDSLVPPRKPRFSLSDTFRPASYYLSGVDPSIDPDGHESSDSDLVSPPPIPIGLSTLVETPMEGKVSSYNSRRNSNESQKSKNSEQEKYFTNQEEINTTAKYYENMDKDKRKPIIEQYKYQGSENEVYVLGSDDAYPPSMGYQEDYFGAVSPMSTPHSQRKLSQHESDVSLLAEDCSNMSIRSTSALSLSLHYHSRNNSFQSTKFDDEKNSARVFQGDYNFADHSLGNVSRSANCDLSGVDEIRSGRFIGSSENLTRSHNTSGLGGGMSRCSSNASASLAQLSEYAIQESYQMPQENVLGAFHQRSHSELSNSSVNSPQNTVALPLTNNSSLHIRQTSASSAGSETSPRSAPYYYSDVIREEDMRLLDASLASYRARYNQLNNQRELEGGKRQDIGRKVNAIAIDQTSPETLKRDIKTTFDYFDNKSIGIPDERNIYESDTLRRLRIRTLTPDPDNQFKNYYPYGISVKTDDFSERPKISHRRTRSLEGILDESVLSRWKFERDNLLQNATLAANYFPASTPESGQRQSSLTTNDIPEGNSLVMPDGIGIVTDSGENNTVYNNIVNGSILSLDNQVNAIKSLPNNFSPMGEENWDDDGEWKEKLRRASLRHTRSLETLDDPRRSSYNNSPRAIRHKPTLALLNECTTESPLLPVSPTKSLDEYHIDYREAPGYSFQSPAKSLDEYQIDYREGRVESFQRIGTNEKSGRNRNGMSSLDKYEWDTTEERFKMSHAKNTPHLSSSNSNQAFLCESLPVSSVMNQGAGPKTPLEELEESANHLQDYTQGNDSDKTEDEGRQDIIEIHNPVPLQNKFKVIWKDDIETEIKQNEAPDIIPSRDIAKFGETLPRRMDYSQQAASETNSNYGFGQNYLSPTRPYAHKPIHHYKKDDLHYARPPPPQYPYDQDGYHEHTYRNYPNEMLETVKASPYQNLQPNQPYQNYYSQYRDLDYNSCDYNNLRSSDNDYSASDIPYQQYSDSDLSMKRRQHRYGRNFVPRKYYEYSAVPNTDLHLDRVGAFSGRNHAKSLCQSSYYKSARGNYQVPVRSRPELNQPYSYSSHQLHSQPQNNEPSSDLYEPQGLLGGVSAGELLGKTHEELVLLLIQLRRHQSALLAARKHTSLEKESQERLLHLDSDRGEEHFIRITYLEEHLLDLDKQFQMGKPLINLVDNMVKLGSLYRGFDSKYSPETEHIPFGPQDSLEFSRRILERRILDEDRSKFDSVAPNQNDLEEKVMQLYKLERKLGEESLRIQDLQRKKEMLERTLYDLHRYSHLGKDNTMEVERRSRQRDHMERELSRLRSHLAVSARRLEDTAVENNRLEHEMMMLRQKIQSNMVRNLNRVSIGTDESQYIEGEMLRVQSLLEELQKRRMELSHQIQRLTSSNEDKSGQNCSPTGISLTQNLKKRAQSTWMETDLDLMITKDRGMEDMELFTSGSFIPSYARQVSRTDKFKGFMNTSGIKDNSFISARNLPTEINANRNLDTNYEFRKLQGFGDRPFDNNDNFQYNQRNPEFDEFSEKKAYEVGLITELDRNSEGNKPDGEEQLPTSVHIDINEADDRTKRFYGLLPKEKALEPKTVRVVKRESTERKRERFPSSKKDVTLSYVEEDDSDNSDDTPDSLPSYTTRTGSLPKSSSRKGYERLNIARSSPNSSAFRPNNLPLRSRPNNAKPRGARSRDDCDMVRALRPRNHPDVVKSTLSTSDVRFNESTIDTIFGAPSKIHIPERYKLDEDDERELTASEKLRREEKARSIRKMLTESSASVTKDDNDNPHCIESKVKSAADKKERERMLSMNQLLAKQVMEKSRMVAARAARANSDFSSSSDDFSPEEQLPTMQQRENLLV